MSNEQANNDPATVTVLHDFDCNHPRPVCACEVRALRERIRDLTGERDWMQAELERRLPWYWRLYFRFFGPAV